MGTDYDCAAARADLGVYLLGALEPAERAEVDQHLQACRQCRERLASLAALPALLRRVPDAYAVLGETASAAQPAGAVPDQLIREIARRRRRTRALAAAVAIALTAVTAVTTSLADHGNSRPAAQAWNATIQAASSATGAWAQVRYAPRAWGTEVETRITGVRPGTRCQLWISVSGSQRISAGGWTIVSGRGVLWYPASVPLAAATLRGFQVTTSAGRILVSIPVHPPAPHRLTTA